MLKRLLDITASVVGLLVFFPLAIPIFITLRLVGEKRIFFRQQRVGRDGRPFNLLKFTTMMDTVATRKDGGLALDNDPEVFKFGRFLRKTKLNEIPQLINVFTGDMSIVGPRPLTGKSFSCYSDHVRESIINVRPGLTGVGSIIFRNEEVILRRSKLPRSVCYREEVLPIKGRLECWYVANESFLLDLKIILLTAWVVVFRDSQLPAKWLDAALIQAQATTPS